MLACALLFVSCAAGNSDNASTTATSTVYAALTQTSRGAKTAKILDLMKSRGEQDEASRL